MNTTVTVKASVTDLREALEAYIAKQRATKVHGAGDYYFGVESGRDSVLDDLDELLFTHTRPACTVAGCTAEVIHHHVPVGADLSRWYVCDTRFGACDEQSTAVGPRRFC